MDTKNAVNPKLEALRKREAALKAAIAVQLVKEQKRRERDNVRLFAIVGEALVNYGSESQDFRTMLRQVLTGAVTDDRARQFLTDRGWL